MKVRALFDEESALMDRIVALRGALAKTGSALPESDPLKKTVSDFDSKVDAVRKQIVATKEGGAITGEERLREHTDQLYGALLSYEGKPGDIELLYDLADKILGKSFCPLGDAAAMPVQSAIKKFRDDFERRIKHNLVQIQMAAD